MPKPKVIASEQNSTFRELKKLLTARGIQDQGQALMAGDKVIPEVEAHHAGRITNWITLEGDPAPKIDVPWLVLDAKLFAELDAFGTGSPLVTVTVPKFATWDDTSPWPEGCTLFVGFQTPDNVGAVVRTAAAFGVSRIVILKEAAHPFHPKSMRSAGTALLASEFLKGPSIKNLEIKGAPLFALDAGGTSLAKTKFPNAFALLPGVEGPGIPAHIPSSAKVSIPMHPGVESLNAATATAIALYEWRRTNH